IRHAVVSRACDAAGNRRPRRILREPAHARRADVYPLVGSRTGAIRVADELRTAAGDAEVHEVAVAAVPRPQTDHSAIEPAEIADFESRRLRGPDIDLNPLALDDDTQRHPAGWLD